MNPDLYAAMFKEAIGYKKSSRLLSQKFDPDYGASSTHLGILAFEILLKCVFTIEKGSRPYNHHYKKIWSEISMPTQKFILDQAQDRYAGHVDLSQIETILDHWERAFSKGRYSYELNENRSPDEIKAIGIQWERTGFRDEDADLVFKPMEREAMFWGMRCWIKNQTGLHSDIEM